MLQWPPSAMAMIVKRTILTVLLLHSLEDAALITVGRFLPFPTPLRYVVGLGLSAALLWYVLSRQRKGNHA